MLKANPEPFPRRENPVQSSMVRTPLRIKQEPLVLTFDEMLAFLVTVWPQAGKENPLTMTCPVMFSFWIVLLTMVELKTVALIRNELLEMVDSLTRLELKSLDVVMRLLMT